MACPSVCLLQCADDAQDHAVLHFFSARMEARRKRSFSSCNYVDALPAEVLGMILSRLECVRSVAMAYMTCKKWQTAVRGWLFKITCALPQGESSKWDNYELLITSVLNQTAHLRDLSVVNGKISASSLWYWLYRTRQSLKSFSFLSRTKRCANILKKLSTLGSNVEKFEWHSGWISASDLIMCRLPSLTSLTLDRVSVGFSRIEDIQLLLSNFCKIEQVSLVNIVIRKAPVRVKLNLPSSLKSLNMKRVKFADDAQAPKATDMTLVLSGVNLSNLHITESPVETNMSLEVEQVKSLQSLVIQDSNIVGLRCGGCFEHLAIWKTPVRCLDVKNLTSLVALTLFNLQTIWPLYLKIKQMASTTMRKLRLLGGLPTFSIEDLYIIASRFPKLHWLSIYHQDTLLFGQPTKNLPVFVHLIDLELYVNNKVTNHDVFAGFVLKLLQCCPNLRRMAIKLQPCSSTPWVEEVQFPCKVASLLREAVHPHTHVRVCVMEALHKIFP